MNPQRPTNLTKVFFSVKFIETNNIFAIRGKETLPISIAWVQTRNTTRVTNHMQLNKFLTVQARVPRSTVSANRWLRGIKTDRFPWYLTLVSPNHGSSNPRQNQTRL